MDTSEEIQKLLDYFFGAYSAGDYVEAVKTLKKLSDLGDVDSSNWLGTMYRYGEDGVEQDTKKALEYYTKGENWSSIADIYYRGAPNIEPNIEEAFRYCLMAVETNDTAAIINKFYAMALLSLIYRDKCDDEESFKWFKRAFELGDNFSYFDEDEFFDCFLRDAQAGNVRSMLKLGYLEKMKGNKVASAAWYKRALDWDNPENIYNLDTIKKIADWYCNGNDSIPVAQDESAAIDWYHRAIDIFNDSESKEILYEIYSSWNRKKNSLIFYDIGCRAKNLFLYNVAIKYLEQAAALGNVDAMIELGDIFYDAGSTEDLHKPEEMIQSDNSKALKFYRQAAEKNYALAFHRLALMNFIECNVEEAYKYFQLDVEAYTAKLNSSFNAFTLKALAKSYEDLHFVERDKRKSKKLLQKFLEYYRLAFGMLEHLADEENIDAFFELGEMYRVGNGTEKSYSNAIKMFKNAAKLGSTDDKIRAYANIAFIHKSDKNYKKFIDYLKKAAKLGDFWAMRQLWKIYERGEFVEQNLSESDKWLKKSEEIQSEFLSSLKQEEF